MSIATVWIRHQCFPTARFVNTLVLSVLLAVVIDGAAAADAAAAAAESNLPFKHPNSHHYNHPNSHPNTNYWTRRTNTNDCLTQLQQSDQDGNQRIDFQEFLNFIDKLWGVNVSGSGEDSSNNKSSTWNENDNTLLAVQARFNYLACTCHFEGGAEDCCEGDNGKVKLSQAVMDPLLMLYICSRLEVQSSTTPQPIVPFAPSWPPALDNWQPWVPLNAPTSMPSFQPSMEPSSSSLSRRPSRQSPSANPSKQTTMTLEPSLASSTQNPTRQSTIQPTRQASISFLPSISQSLPLEYEQTAIPIALAPTNDLDVSFRQELEQALSLLYFTSRRRHGRLGQSLPQNQRQQPDDPPNVEIIDETAISCPSVVNSTWTCLNVTVLVPIPPNMNADDILSRIETSLQDGSLQQYIFELNPQSRITVLDIANSSPPPPTTTTTITNVPSVSPSSYISWSTYPPESGTNNGGSTTTTSSQDNSPTSDDGGSGMSRLVVGFLVALGVVVTLLGFWVMLVIGRRQVRKEKSMDNEILAASQELQQEQQQQPPPPTHQGRRDLDSTTPFLMPPLLINSLTASQRISSRHDFDLHASSSFRRGTSWNETESLLVESNASQVRTDVASSRNDSRNFDIVQDETSMVPDSKLAIGVGVGILASEKLSFRSKNSSTYNVSPGKNDMTHEASSPSNTDLASKESSNGQSKDFNSSTTENVQALGAENATEKTKELIKSQDSFNNSLGDDESVHRRSSSSSSSSHSSSQDWTERNLDPPEKWVKASETVQFVVPTKFNDGGRKGAASSSPTVLEDSEDTSSDSSSSEEESTSEEDSSTSSSSSSDSSSSDEFGTGISNYDPKDAEIAIEAAAIGGVMIDSGRHGQRERKAFHEEGSIKVNDEVTSSTEESRAWDVPRMDGTETSMTVGAIGTTQSVYQEPDESEGMRGNVVPLAVGLHRDKLHSKEDQASRHEKNFESEGHEAALSDTTPDVVILPVAAVTQVVSSDLDGYRHDEEATTTKDSLGNKDFGGDMVSTDHVASDVGQKIAGHSLASNANAAATLASSSDNDSSSDYSSRSSDLDESSADLVISSTGIVGNLPSFDSDSDESGSHTSQGNIALPPSPYNDSISDYNNRQVLHNEPGLKSSLRSLLASQSLVNDSEVLSNVPLPMEDSCSDLETRNREILGDAVALKSSIIPQNEQDADVLDQENQTTETIRPRSFRFSRTSNATTMAAESPRLSNSSTVGASRSVDAETGPESEAWTSHSTRRISQRLSTFVNSVRSNSMLRRKTLSDPNMAQSYDSNDLRASLPPPELSEMIAADFRRASLALIPDDDGSAESSYFSSEGVAVEGETTLKIHRDDKMKGESIKSKVSSQSGRQFAVNAVSIPDDNDTSQVDTSVTKPQEGQFYEDIWGSIPEFSIADLNTFQSEKELESKPADGQGSEEIWGLIAEASASDLNRLDDTLVWALSKSLGTLAALVRAGALSIPPDVEQLSSSSSELSGKGHEVLSSASSSSLPFPGCQSLSDEEIHLFED